MRGAPRHARWAHAVDHEGAATTHGNARQTRQGKHKQRDVDDKRAPLVAHSPFAKQRSQMRFGAPDRDDSRNLRLSLHCPHTIWPHCCGRACDGGHQKYLGAPTPRRLLHKGCCGTAPSSEGRHRDWAQKRQSARGNQSVPALRRFAGRTHPAVVLARGKAERDAAARAVLDVRVVYPHARLARLLGLAEEVHGGTRGSPAAGALSALSEHAVVLARCSGGKTVRVLHTASARAGAGSAGSRAPAAEDWRTARPGACSGAKGSRGRFAGADPTREWGQGRKGARTPIQEDWETTPRDRSSRVSPGSVVAVRELRRERLSTPGGSPEEGPA